VRYGGRGGRALLALVALVALASVAGGTEAEIEYALRSDLAIRSLLLDVDRAGDRLVAVGAWGHVVLSDDDGLTWRQARSVPTRRTLTSVSFPDAQHGWAVGHDAVVIHSSDGGETWVRQFDAADEEATLLSVWFENARHGFAVGSFGLMLETRDGGATWSRRRLGKPGEEDPHLNEIFRGPEGSLFVAAEFGRVYRTLDGGATWQRFETGYEGSMWGGIALPDGDLLVYGLRGHAFRSEDLGETWREVETGTEQSIQDASMLPGGVLALVGLGGLMEQSRDEGRTFEVGYVPDRRGIAAVTPGRGTEVLLFGERGVRRRRLSGEALPLPTL
jgi:photosystem II stability/assembly factor-like uncharacterized protein